MENETVAAVVEETSTPQETAQTIADVLRGYKGAPSASKIEEWKAEFGEVYVSGFSEEDLFVWRPLYRPEYIKIQVKISNPELGLTQFDVEEMVCETCILWKSKEGQLQNTKAGTLATLSEQIMNNSNFLSAQASSVLVARL